MKLLPKDPSKFSFGATSSTVTSLGIIFGLLSSGNPQASVIGSLLVIAVADNIADSLGIHIYRESTSNTKRKHPNVHNQQLHHPIRYHIDFCCVVCVSTNKFCCSCVHDNRNGHPGFPKLPYRGPTQNQHNKRNAYPPRNCHSRNNNQPLSGTTNIQHIWVMYVKKTVNVNCGMLS